MKNLSLLIVKDIDVNGYEKMSNFGHIIADIIEINENNMPRNFRFSYIDHKDWQHFENLSISCQMDNKDDKTYGYRVCFRETYYVDLRKSERQVKTLRKIENKLNKMNKEMGNPELNNDFGSYLLRVAKAIGIKNFVFFKNPDNRNSNYDENEYIFIKNPEDFKNKIIEMEEEIKREIKK